jgi:GH25 family lysozyme M1 (1,4-beta-N-acetylmuramidase)
MKSVITLVLCVCTWSHAEATEFNRPWKNDEVALVIDPYAQNKVDWDKLTSEKRVIAVIHKATIGTSRLDKRYLERRSEAKRRGLLWGSYHWGVAGSPVAQADYYIDTVKPADDELMALDLEDVTSKTLMGADEALVFVKRIKQRTGRYPVLYTNHASAKILSKKFKNSIFQEIPLWYARFKPEVSDFPSGIWKTYTLWQFSSEILFQHPVAGTARDMDINVYNGSVPELRAAWPLTRRANPSNVND